MGVRLQNWIGLLATISSLSVAGAIITEPMPSNAQESGQTTVQEAFMRTFYDNDKPFFQNRGIGRQIDFLFGQGTLYRNSFVENEMNRDGREVHNLYLDVLNQQVSSDPIIRTPDLPNPYNSSIFSQPPAPAFNNRIPGSELNFESIPLR